MNLRLAHHMRIAALQCNFEGGREQTLLVPKLWKEFGFNVEQLFHTHSEMYSAVFDKEKHEDLLREYLTEAKKNGISIILYMNCHILLDSQKNKISEWAQVDKDGNYILLYNTYNACCINSSWTDFFLTSIGNLKDTDICGIFFDGPVSTPCFCERCNEKFNNDYGIPLPEGSIAQMAEFLLRNQIEFMKKTYRKVKSTNSDWISYFNLGLMHSKASSVEMEEILSCSDLIGTEGGFQFYGPPRNCDIWRCGIHARLVEAVASEKPKIIFMAGDHKPWSWYLHTPAETKLCYASALANGSSVWYGIHCSTDNLNSASGKAAKEMVRFDKKYDDLYNRTKSTAEVALFFSFDTSKYYTSSGEETDFYQGTTFEAQNAIGNYTDSFQGACDILFRASVSFDIITKLNLETLSNYKALVIPTGACMVQKTADAIRTFVQEGGIVIADSETSLYDETLKKRRNFLLSNMLGVTFNNRYRQHQTHDYFALEKDFDIFEDTGTKYIPAPIHALDVSVSERSEIMAKLFPPIQGRYAGRPETAKYPFIVRNSSGKGLTYYFAGTFFEMYRKYGITHYKKLIKNIIEQHSKPLVELLNAPESVEFTVRKSLPSGAIMVHLINYSGGMTRPIEKIIPVCGMSLKINRTVSSARALVANKKLDLRKDGLVNLPEVKEFEVVVIE